MSCSKKMKNGGLLELLAWGRGELSSAGVEEAQEECERILMKLLGCARSAIYLEEHALTGSLRGSFLELVEKRLQRIPLAYLLKEANFWHETLFVDERCLIPRPETEILVEVVVREMKGSRSSKSLRAGGEAIPLLKADRHAPLGLAMTTWEQAFTFLDIGTGSGAIAIALLREFPKAHGTLLDISEGALEAARMNVEKYGLQDRARLVKGDVFDGFPPFAKGERGGFNKSPLTPLYKRGEFAEGWDLIVSNPPYLSAKDFEGLQPEVGFEPRQALEGGADGLDFYKKIIAGAQDHLTPGGMIAFEVGQGQSGKVSTWLQDAGYDNIQRFKDYLGIERVVIARKTG